MNIFSTYKLYKFYSALFATLNIALPIIIVSLLAYKFGNWWLLIGIGVSFCGSFMVLPKGHAIIGFATLFCIGFWIKSGFNIHQYVTFYYFCLLFGFMSFSL